MREFRDGVIVEVPDESPVAVTYVPLVISRFQGEAILLEDGRLDDVEAAIAQADARSQLAWKRATEFHRNSETLALIAAALGWTDEYVDSVFIRGIRLKA